MRRAKTRREVEDEKREIQFQLKFPAEENAHASKGISKEFKGWIAIAKDRPKWKQQTHSKPKPPDD